VGHVTPAWGLAIKPENIPRALQQQRRWLVWAAVARATGKVDKQPRRPDNPQIKVRWKDEANWLSFDVAVAAVANSEMLSGVGFVLNDINSDVFSEPVVAIDLDKCLDDQGACNTTAENIQTDIPTYWERSPSGNGLRAFCFGQIATDISNLQEGVEVYGGHASRFVTVTGHRVGSQTRVLAADTKALEKVVANYGKSKNAKTALDTGKAAPDILTGEDTRALVARVDTLLKPELVQFVTTGQPAERHQESTGGSSAAVAALLSTLYSNGLTDSEVLSYALQNTHVYQYALRKRQDDHSRAFEFLWSECQRMGAFIAPDVSSVFDFLGPTGKDKLVAESVGRKRRFDFFTIEELINLPTPNWRVAGVWPERGLGVVWGAPGSGKTFAVLDLALAVARGIPFYGRETRQGTVVYIAAEGDLKLRAKAYLTHNNLSPVELQNKFRIVQSSMNLLGPDSDIAALVLDLHSLVEELGGIDVIIIDTLNRTMPGGNENSPEDMGSMVYSAAQLGEVFDCLAVFVHHSGKDASKGSRGHSSLHGATDCELSVKRLDLTNRVLKIEKLRDGEDGLELLNFELQTVPLDGEQNDLSSCVLKETAGPVQSLHLTPGELQVVGFLREIVWDIENDEKMSQHVPAAKKARKLLIHNDHAGTNDLKWGVPRDVFLAHVKAECDAAGTSWDTTRKRANRGLKKLHDLDFIKLFDDWIFCWDTWDMLGH